MMPAAKGARGRAAAEVRTASDPAAAFHAKRTGV
jgi:hypothetical protein